MATISRHWNDALGSLPYQKVALHLEMFKFSRSCQKQVSYIYGCLTKTALFAEQTWVAQTEALQHPDMPVTHRL